MDEFLSGRRGMRFPSSAPRSRRPTAATMAWQVLLLVAVCLSACGTPNGPTLEAVTQRAGPPKTGHARVVVYREPLFAPVGDRGYPIKLDGQPMGDLWAGSFVSLDRPAGPHQLSLDLWDMPGVSRQHFDAVAGRTHYFVVRMSDRGKAITAGTIFGGLAGYALTAAVTSGDDKGTMDFISVDEATAQKAVSELRQVSQ
jgi:hypothetical protein